MKTRRPSRADLRILAHALDRDDHRSMPSKPRLGGARPGAGRKPTTGRGSVGRTVIAASFAPDEILEIDRLRGKTPRATWLWEVAMAAARNR